MGYPGTFTFIVRDSSTHPRSKNYDHNAAVATHISRTRRHRMEEERKAQRKACNQPVSQVRQPKLVRTSVKLNSTGTDAYEAIARKPTASRPEESGDEPSKSSHDPEIVQSHSRNESRTANPSTDSLLAGSLALFKGNSDPFSSACITVTPQIHELLYLSSQFVVFWVWSSAMSSLFRSKAQESWLSSLRSSIQGMTAMHLLLSAGSLIRAKRAMDPIEKRQASSQALAHKTLALGDLRQQLARHQDYHVDSDIFPLIFQLVSMDFYTGNEEAALWHYTAIRQLVTRARDRDLIRNPPRNASMSVSKPPTQRPVYAIAEVWIAVSNLQRPTACGMVDWHGERQSASDQDHEQFAVPPDSSTFFLYDLEWPTLHPSIADPLRPIFREIQRVAMYMQQLHHPQHYSLDEVETFQLANYLDQQGTKLRADLLQLYLDTQSLDQQDNSISQYFCPAKRNEIEGAMLSVQTLAALLFINIIFMYKPNPKPEPTHSRTDPYTSEMPGIPGIPGIVRLMNPSINSRALRCLQRHLRFITRHEQQIWDGHMPSLIQFDEPVLDILNNSYSDINSDLNLNLNLNATSLLWLTFISTLTNRLQTLDTDTEMETEMETESITQPSSPGAQNTFKSYASMLGCRSPTDVRRKLNDFIYLDGLMDWFLEETFSTGTTVARATSVSDVGGSDLWFGLES